MTNRMTDAPREQTLFYTRAIRGSISNDFPGNIGISVRRSSAARAERVSEPNPNTEP